MSQAKIANIRLKPMNNPIEITRASPGKSTSLSHKKISLK